MAELLISKNHVLTHEHFNLYHYDSNKACFSERPIILIVYSLINSPAILDLDPKRTFIGQLCETGCEVYLVDWGHPKPHAAQLTLKNYALDFLDQITDFILTKHHISALTLMGVCQGGVLSLCYAAWRAEKVATLITMVTPVDFQTEDNLIAQRMNFTLVKQWVENCGNFPGSTLNWFLTMLKPEHTLWNKFKKFLSLREEPQEVALALKMEQWIYDMPDHPGQMLIDFIKDFYLDNSLMKNEYFLGEQKLNWSAIQMPVLNIYALQDHLVSPSAASALQQALAGNKYYEAWSISAGHIGLFVSRDQIEVLPLKIKQWLDSSSA